MKLDGELSRLALEHGTMLGPPTEVELAEERVRKERARKVRGPAAGTQTLCFPGRADSARIPTLKTKPANPHFHLPFD